MSAATVGGGDVVPADGAVLMATGASAAKLQAEAPVGTPVTSRLILQPAWAGVVAALGGGPVLVRNSKPVFRSLEDFTNDQVTQRDARAGVGQLADGRIVLVAVDGRQPGYSVGLTSFELAQTLQRLGAVTASAVDPGGSVTVAFDGQLLNRPSDPGGERAVKEALLVQYFGVFAAQPPLPLLNGDAARSVEPLSYKIVRPSKVTAQLIGPDNVPRVLEAAVAHPPGSYPFTFTSYDVEGTWHWNVQATDDLGRSSTIDRTFRYDTTLKGLSASAARARTRDVPLHALACGEGAAADRDEDRRRHAHAGAGRALRGHAVGRLGRSPAARARRRTPGPTSRTSSRRARSERPTLLLQFAFRRG